jgi:hypothetical protein
MNKIVKTKLCWNCEGIVALTAENCPYCGVSVVPASLDGKPASFSPPYRMGSSQPVDAESMSIPSSPYAFGALKKAEEESEAVQSELPDEAVSNLKAAMLALLCLLSGSTLLLFGGVLALFSQNGVLTLQWNSSYWFVYLGGALLLLLLGWMSFRSVNED